MNECKPGLLAAPSDTRALHRPWSKQTALESSDSTQNGVSAGNDGIGTTDDIIVEIGGGGVGTLHVHIKGKPCVRFPPRETFVGNST